MKKILITILISIIFLSGCSFNLKKDIKNQAQKKESLLGGVGGTCGNYTIDFNGLTYGTVLAEDGRCWLDRNIGATEVATSSSDYLAYGDLYEWGRLTDGHQVRTSSVIFTGSPGDVPGNSNYIASTTSPYDWRYPQNDNLWQAVTNINNPCPSGWRLPTSGTGSEWRLWTDAAGITSCTSDCLTKAFNTKLKLVAGGNRLYNNGALANIKTYGYYWSKTVYNTSIGWGRHFIFNATAVSSAGTAYRAYGEAVRCIQGDTCTYSGTGDWTVQQSDVCYIAGNVYVNGVVNLIGSSTGMFDCAPGVKVSATKFNFDHSQAPTKINSNCKAYHF